MVSANIPQINLTDYDVLIKNAQIVDGVNKEFIGDLGVKDGRIYDSGSLGSDAEHVIDAEGLYALPGFIDPHSHGDWGFAWYPNCESAVMQGCTTVVAGQCGGSTAPLNEFIRVPGVLSSEIYEKHPYIYHGSRLFPLEEVNTLMKEKYGWTIDYRTMGEYFEVIEEKGISVNYVPLLGHGTIRFHVMGKDYKREATQPEIDSMKELILEGLLEGCRGLSSGLDYDPDVFATTDEMNQCVSVLKTVDGIYVPHWRRTGRRRDVKMGSFNAEPIDGILEVLETARKTGVRLNIAHLAPGWHTTPEMTSELGEAIGYATLKPIDEAIAEGLDVNFDVIPWQCWEPLPYLSSLHFTQWLRLLGGREKLAEWLKIEEFRKKAWDEIESGKIFQRLVINPCVNKRWAENLKIVTHKDTRFAGKTLEKAAKILETDPWNALCDLIVLDIDSMGAHTDYRGIEEQMKTFFKHPLGTVGLDVGIMNDENVMKRYPPYATPLPDTFSGYPKFFMRYVRDSNFLSMEEAVQKTSTIPAKTYKLTDRGTLQPGAFADIVLMNLENLAHTGHPELTTTYPKGIPYVLVNGKIVVENGVHKGSRPGLILGG